jgi:hypothetical protein
MHRDTYGVAATDVRRELALERVDLGSEDRASRREHTSDRRLDLVSVRRDRRSDVVEGNRLVHATPFHV